MSTETLKMYSLVSEEAFRKLQQDGVLVCDLPKCTGDEVNQMLHPYYDWMGAQMEKRGLQKPESAVHPLWLWSVYNNVNGGKPDFYEEGESGYLLECHIPKNQVLQSDFMLWSAVLVDCFLPPHDNPDQDCENPSQEELEASWERVFDLDNHYRDFSSVNVEERCVQACTWQIRLEHVNAYETINL